MDINSQTLKQDWKETKEDVERVGDAARHLGQKTEDKAAEELDRLKEAGRHTEEAMKRETHSLEDRF